MGPTYLVLLVNGGAAIVIYDGKDEAEARRLYEREYSVRRDDGGAIEGKHAIYLTTVRAEAKLS